MPKFDQIVPAFLDDMESRGLLARTQIDLHLQARASPSDLVQEAFLEAYRDFGQFRGRTESELLAWLRRILVHNLARLVEKEVRAQKRNVRREVPLERHMIALDRSSQKVERALVSQGQANAGIEEHQRAIELNPDHAQAHINLGNAFRIRNELDSASSEYRTAIQLNPRLAAPHWNLAQTLMDQAKFAEALVYLRHGQEVSLRDRYGRYPWAARLRECERMIELDGKLAEVLADNERVANAEERTDYAMLCYSKRLFAIGARFYERAFAEEPKLAEDIGNLHRYRAACNAALAGCRQGEDSGAPGLDDGERRRLRQQALDWLRADLAQHAKALKSPDPKERQPALTQLRHWLVDPDLAGVRDEESLAKLPEVEQEPWRKLWAEVVDLLKEHSGQ